MNERQRTFVDHYLQSGNAAESARAAGYSELSSAKIGYNLLQKAEIKKALEDAKGKSSSTSESEITLDALIKTAKEICDEALEKGNISEKVKALESLAKLSGNWQEKQAPGSGFQVVINTYRKQDEQKPIDVTPERTGTDDSKD